MMGITQDLMKLDPSLILAEEGNYKNFNTGGVEIEVGDFLYGLVRTIKPDAILETGTHQCIGAAYMGLALKENGKGKLLTLEFMWEYVAMAKKRIETLGLKDVVMCLQQDSRTFKTDVMFDLILLDTEPQYRFGELVALFDNLKPGGFMFIHDLGRGMSQVEHTNGLEYGWPFFKIPDAMEKLVVDGKLVPWHFGTHRGFMGFYKPHPGDYKWKA